MARIIQVPPAKMKPRIVDMIQTFGNCHSTGCRAYGARSYAIAMVATSAKMAKKLAERQGVDIAPDGRDHLHDEIDPDRLVHDQDREHDV